MSVLDALNTIQLVYELKKNPPHLLLLVRSSSGLVVKPSSPKMYTPKWSI